MPRNIPGPLCLVKTLEWGIWARVPLKCSVPGKRDSGKISYPQPPFSSLPFPPCWAMCCKLQSPEGHQLNSQPKDLIRTKVNFLGLFSKSPQVQIDKLIDSEKNGYLVLSFFVWFYLFCRLWRYDLPWNWARKTICVSIQTFKVTVYYQWFGLRKNYWTRFSSTFR